MRIPPLYKKPSWQRFFAGMAIGGVISWGIFLYIFGEWQNEYSKTIKKQAKDIQDLTKDKKIWQQEFQKLNKENKEKLTIQKIKVRITNSERYRLNTFSEFEVEEKVKEDIYMLLAKDIETAYNSRDLITKVIENQTFKIHGKRYKLEVREIVFYTTLSINLHIHLEE
ncbi:sporulation membrane protein YtrI [Bacillus massilinigeriensis]|uniref:sporulation membrane protein YtrI n=1 Tax=Bacillus massilionigeriensis TaxID=1805475 RepID=UPI00096AFFDB|nr:sporulation membrane protein YtrI [Bacillus massilionigeriensis]